MGCLGCRRYTTCGPESDCVIEEAYDSMKDFEDGFGQVAVLTNDEPAGSQQIHELLKGSGISSALFRPEMTTRKQMELAVTLCCSYLVLTNQKLWAQKKVVVKSVATGKYETVSYKALVPYLRQKVTRFFAEAEVGGEC